MAATQPTTPPKFKAPKADPTREELRQRLVDKKVQLLQNLAQVNKTVNPVGYRNLDKEIKDLDETIRKMGGKRRTRRHHKKTQKRKHHRKTSHRRK